jgi:hypothetical protein
MWQHHSQVSGAIITLEQRWYQLDPDSHTRGAELSQRKDDFRAPFLLRLLPKTGRPGS